jgi:hypothetical protein
VASVASLGSSFLTASGTKTVTAVPTVGDVIVIVTAHTGYTGATAPTDNNSDGLGTYTQVGANAVKVTSADRMQMWIRNAAIGSGTSTVFTHAPGTTSGGGLNVLRIPGMSKVGSAAVRASAVQSNQAAATPAPVLPQAAAGNNPLIGAIFNAGNPATMSKPASFDAELVDLGYNNPPSGLETAKDDTGNTDTTVTWGSSSGTEFCSIVAEFDTTKVIAVGQASETDSSGATTPRRAKAVSQASETDTSQAVASKKTTPVTQVSEADTAASITRLKRTTLGESQETDTSQTVTRRKTVILGQASETDAATAASSTKIHGVAQANEIDAAQAVARLKRITLGESQETATAQTITPSEVHGFGQALETDSAAVITPTTAGQIVTAGQASETDSAGTITPLRTYPVAQAQATETSGAVSPLRVLVIAQATEADTAQLVNTPGQIVVNPAFEIDTANAITAPTIVVLAQAEESDTARPISVTGQEGTGIVLSPTRVLISAAHNEVT